MISKRVVEVIDGKEQMNKEETNGESRRMRERETRRRLDPSRKYSGISHGMNSELCVRQMRGHEN